MAEKEGYDVLRLIEHGQTCYISSEYAGGKVLAGWLKIHPNITKERLYLLIRDITNQLCMIHRCRKKPYYQFVNPYSIVITEEGEVYFLDLEAGSNEERLRLMQKRAVREAFLPPEEPYYQKASLELDIYGLGKTIQYVLAMAKPIPALCKREERKFLRIISRCLNNNSRMSYKNISDIRRSIPRYIQKTKPDIRVKKKVLFVCAAISFLAAVWKINGTEKNPLMIPEELELSEAGEAAGEDKKDEDTEVMMSDERELRIELAILYILNVEDYEKGLEYLKRIGSEYVSARNLRAAARALLGDKRELTELAEGSEMELRELENSISEDQLLGYYQCLLKGYALLDTEQASRIVLSLGESCMERLEEDREESRESGESSAKETEIRRYMAAASEKIGEFEEAAHICEEMLKLEEDEEKREELYCKTAMLYEECGQNGKAGDICVQGIKELSDSEELRVMHIRMLYEDASVDRAFCAQMTEEYVRQMPGLQENEDFQKLRFTYMPEDEG